jgi:hypothetical protein
MSAQPVDDSAHRFGITIFKDKQAPAGSESSIDLDELADLIEKSTAIKKDDLPLLKLARFGATPTSKGCLRHDANVVSVHGVELDYDGEAMTLDAAYEALESAGIEALLHSTSRSEPDAPRWRVLAPLAKSITGTADLALQQAEEQISELIGTVLLEENIRAQLELLKESAKQYKAALHEVESALAVFNSGSRFAHKPHACSSVTSAIRPILEQATKDVRPIEGYLETRDDLEQRRQYWKQRAEALRADPNAP